MLYRLALTHTQNSEDAQDAVQDVFTKYITASPVFTDAEHQRAWLIRATVNRCHDLLRRHKVREYVPLDEIAEFTADPDGQDADLALDVMQSLAKIPEKNRAAIVLHHLEGLSVEDTAKALGISVSAVKMRLARGREALKEQIGREETHV
ncbi:MAG: RNA polymerase sigma factor [Clostridiales bacterium]|nr:RNA polymerase sigma factor [Clostridiales bacterium]MBQ3107814.1 RNA polymerase sigma factor [Bacillota bacterium]